MNAQSSIAQLLPAAFAFSQSSLQAYHDCARRFWLAYVEQLPWPAAEASPIQEHEARMRQGGLFHRLVERAEIGMDPAAISVGLTEPLTDWFDKYQRFRPTDLPEDIVEIEKVLSIPFSPAPLADDTRALSNAVQLPAYRLAAKYDLIAIEPGRRAVIIDWKTSARRGDEASLRTRWQSVVYPYVLAEASQALPWGPIAPHQIEMRYWFTATPRRPIQLPYSAERHIANRERLSSLLSEILVGKDEGDFPKVDDTPINRKRFCAYCVYRSRCNRGDVAGNLDELDDPELYFAVNIVDDLEFTLDDVAEIAF